MKRITSRCFITAFLSLFALLQIQLLSAQTNWMRVPTPDTSPTRNMLRGISGTSSSDIWTVGSFEETLDFPPFNKQNDLIMHWDGLIWNTYAPLNLSNTLDDLFDVEAIAPGNVWAVGIFNGASDPRAEILHFDGNSWTAQNPPAITGGSGLFSMDATAANDIWAAGYKTASPTRPAYVQHYNGSSWSEIAVPPVGLYRNEFAWIDAISATDVWAAGFYGETSGDFHSMVMRWNGSSWQNIALPASVTSPQSEVLSIKAISANDVWAVGYYLAGGGFKIHWDGSTWSESPEPNGGGGAFAAISSNDVFSVGSEIWHWDGSSWSPDDTLDAITYPSLVNTITLPNGDIWACGVETDLDAHFHTLVYRTEPQLSTSSQAADGNHVAVFPNPALDHISVRVDNPGAADFTISDILGKVMMSGVITGTSTTEFNLNQYAGGTYFLRVSAEGFTEVKKFIVTE